MMNNIEKRLRSLKARQCGRYRGFNNTAAYMLPLQKFSI